ncbi:thioredoxin [Candidatus Woesearchaeota archaeon]|nr:thioredoxin [Candidatus Woesearchaeota archaeon]
MNVILKMLDLTKDTFEREVLQNKMPVLVDFWAPWCGPCRIVSPALEKLSNEYLNKLKFTKLNVDDNQEIAAQFDVRGIPCMIIFNKGNELDRVVGAYPEAELRKKIDLILAKA